VSGESDHDFEGRATVPNLQGLHFRPVGLLTQLAQTFTADITITFDTQTVDAKSAIALTMLGAPQGSELVVRAKGPDAEQSVREIVDLIGRSFGLADTD
jgi:phosphocarrier protein HPr